MNNIALNTETSGRNAGPLAVAYLRSASIPPGDTHAAAQWERCQSCADRLGLTIVATFEDRAVSGRSDAATREGFGALLERIDRRDVSVVLVDDLARIARDLARALEAVTLIEARGAALWSKDGLWISAALLNAPDATPGNRCRLTSAFRGRAKP